jgi:hypothetical protein
VPPIITPEIVGVAVKAGPAPARTWPAAPVIDRAPVVALKLNGEEAETAKVPLALGSVSVGVPAIACAVIVAVPVVPPAKAKEPVAVEALPTVSVLLEKVRLALSCNKLPESYINCPAAPPLVGVVPGISVTNADGEAQDIMPLASESKA